MTDKVVTANNQNKEQPNAPHIDWWSGWQGDMHLFSSEWWFTDRRQLFRVVWHQDMHPSQSYVRLSMMILSGWSVITQMPASAYPLTYEDLEQHSEDKDASMDEMWEDMVRAAELAAKALNHAL